MEMEKLLIFGKLNPTGDYHEKDNKKGRGLCPHSLSFFFDPLPSWSQRGRNTSPCTLSYGAPSELPGSGVRCPQGQAKSTGTRRDFHHCCSTGFSPHPRSDKARGISGQGASQWPN